MYVGGRGFNVIIYVRWMFNIDQQSFGLTPHVRLPHLLHLRRPCRLYSQDREGIYVIPSVTCYRLQLAGAFHAIGCTLYVRYLQLCHWLIAESDKIFHSILKRSKLHLL